MQTSTWNDTNQHWIPQFLLKGFGIKGKSSKTYELNKETMSVTIRNVNKIASKAHLLTEQDDGLMRIIESRAAPAIDAIRKNRLNRFSINERKVIDQLVCSMILNDPNNGLDAEATRKEVIAKITAELNTALNKVGGMLDEPDIREYFDEQLTHDLLSSFMESNRNQVIDSLRFMGLQACQAPDGELFVIGDSPVLVVRNPVNDDGNLLNPGSQVILPISSTCILVYAWATEMNLIADGDILAKEQVRSLNSDYYHGTNSKYIYGRDEDVLKRSQLMTLGRPLGERSTEVKSGWYMMQLVNQNRQRQQEVQNAAHAKLLEEGALELVKRAIAKSENAVSSVEVRHRLSR